MNTRPNYPKVKTYELECVSMLDKHEGTSDRCIVWDVDCRLYMDIMVLCNNHSRNKHYKSWSPDQTNIILSHASQTLKLYISNFNKHSERSEECIDFTMIGKKLTFSNSFQKNREKQKKNDGKTGIFTQNTFSTKSNYFYGCNSKTNH
ncbi:Uncharacterized protein FWK35_00032454 [Aphis craccivora]|uniref:Uncharacterized protein n=1 Tax=Aphis craccivora TaxID=307492 RepID=A0A6G0VP63_APHCR|nr:Uncharacterized protein FWK35_00032454 [Aphis craccivora]